MPPGGEKLRVQLQTRQIPNDQKIKIGSCPTSAYGSTIDGEERKKTTNRKEMNTTIHFPGGGHKTTHALECLCTASPHQLVSQSRPPFGGARKPEEKGRKTRRSGSALTERRSEEVSEQVVQEGGGGEGGGMFRRSCSAASVLQVPLGGDQVEF